MSTIDSGLYSTDSTDSDQDPDKTTQGIKLFLSYFTWLSFDFILITLNIDFFLYFLNSTFFLDLKRLLWGTLFKEKD